MRKLNFKVIQVFLVIALLFSFCSTMVTSKTFAEPKTVTVELTIENPEYQLDGQPQPNMEYPPFVENSRILIPVRIFTEAFFVSIHFEIESMKSNTVTFSNGKTEIEIQTNNKTAKVNGKEIQIDTPSIIRLGRTFAPVRFIMETFGATVTWDPILHKVTIVYEIPEG